MNALLFNPQNDIALARDVASFTPPRQALLLARHGAPLMRVLGTPADRLIEPFGPAVATEAEATRADVFTPCGGLLPDHPGRIVPVPWGWSTNAVATMRHCGVEVPDGFAAQMPRMRRLSHRATAGEANRRLAADIDWAAYGMPAPQAATEAFTPAEAARAIATLGGNGFVKEPWSSSGRGVWQPSGLPPKVVEERITGTIAHQGSVLIEPAHCKCTDFAMLFRSTESGTMEFAGYSLFLNRHTTAYAGNIIASDAYIEAALTPHIPASMLAAVRRSLARFLTDAMKPVIAAAEGIPLFAGVDMMIADATANGGPIHRSGNIDACHNVDTFHCSGNVDTYHNSGNVDTFHCSGNVDTYLVPCVEINFRLTMGFVALALRRAFTEPHLFAITPASAPPPPPGAIPLIAPNPHFSITAAPLYAPNL